MNKQATGSSSVQSRWEWGKSGTKVMDTSHHQGFATKALLQASMADPAHLTDKFIHPAWWQAWWQVAGASAKSSARSNSRKTAEISLLQLPRQGPL